MENAKLLNVVVFLGSITVMNARLCCLTVVFIDLDLYVIIVTVTIFQGHSARRETVETESCIPL